MLLGEGAEAGAGHRSADSKSTWPSVSSAEITRGPEPRDTTHPAGQGHPGAAALRAGSKACPQIPGLLAPPGPSRGGLDSPSPACGRHPLTPPNKENRLGWRAPTSEAGVQEAWGFCLSLRAPLYLSLGSLWEASCPLQRRTGKGGLLRAASEDPAAAELAWERILQPQGTRWVTTTAATGPRAREPPRQQLPDSRPAETTG